MILSIDIGLRNLSMCIMSCEDKTNLETYKIHLWDVYNTLDSDDHLCESLQKSGKVCNKKCSLKYNTLPTSVDDGRGTLPTSVDDGRGLDNKTIFTCKTHFPKELLPIKKTNEFKKKAIDDYLLQDIAKIVLSKIQDIYDTHLPIFEQLTSIIIELQPKINAKMKFTSHIIYGKLVEIYRETSTTVRFVRASQKLKAYTGPVLECKLKGAYAKRKWLSIQYTNWFLENKFLKEQKEKWLSFVLSHKKADDMCDTFLMAINALHGIPPKQKFQKNGKCIK